MDSSALRLGHRRQFLTRVSPIHVGIRSLHPAFDSYVVVTPQSEISFSFSLSFFKIIFLEIFLAFFASLGRFFACDVVDRILALPTYSFALRSSMRLLLCSCALLLWVALFFLILIAFYGRRTRFILFLYFTYEFFNFSFFNCCFSFGPI